MKAIRIAALLLATALAGTPHAQVRKCIGPDGKVTYSDALCTKDTAKEAGVKVDANTLDASGARADARQYRMDKLIAQARQKDPNLCKFSVEASDLGNGNRLASEATQECLLNLGAKEAGQPVLHEAYDRWYDNQQLQLSKRQAAATEQRDAANLEQRRREVEQAEKDAKCKTDKSKGMTCSR